MTIKNRSFCDIFKSIDKTICEFTVLFPSTFKHMIENLTIKNVFIHLYVIVSHE